jgi:hypothetical protein
VISAGFQRTVTRNIHDFRIRRILKLQIHANRNILYSPNILDKKREKWSSFREQQQCEKLKGRADEGEDFFLEQ